MSENLTLVTRRASEILIRPHQRDNPDSHRPPVPMSTATKARQSWTVTEWTAFVQRSRDVQERLWQAIKAVERTPGFSVEITARIRKAMNRIGVGLCALESIVEEDCGVDPMPLIHGPNGSVPAPTPLPESRFAHLPAHRLRRGSVLSQEAWTIEGQYIRALRAELFALAVDLGENCRRTRIRESANYFVKADRDLTSAIACLESLLTKHHPDVPNPTAFF